MTNSLRILIVDDDVDNANSLGELFELEGHRPLVVYDGESAIAAYEAEDFDIAFMDVMMPGKNGVESFFEIRSLKPTAKIYMMTGYSVEQLLQQAIDGGAMGVLSKPVNLYRVLEAVANIGETGIVVVSDDDPDFGAGLNQLINRQGFRCELAQTGQEAVARAKSGTLDVLLLDLKLPRVDGLEVLANIKGDPALKLTPVVMLTSSREERDVARSYALGANAYVVKPMDFKTFADTLKEVGIFWATINQSPPVA